MLESTILTGNDQVVPSHVVTCVERPPLLTTSAAQDEVDPHDSLPIELAALAILHECPSQVKKSWGLSATQNEGDLQDTDPTVFPATSAGADHFMPSHMLA